MVKKWLRKKAVLPRQILPCGRSGKEKGDRPYPACRPKKVAPRITKQEASKKTGPKRVEWSTTASGKKGK